jgi:hypothetical protein
MKDLQRDEVVYVGRDGALKGVRCTRRVIEEPVDPTNPEGKKRQRQIWFSHDVAAMGRAKAFPAQNGGERRAVSWDKKLSAEDCAAAAGHYPTAEEEERRRKEQQKAAEPGMDEPAMGEPGMEEPGMAEPGMDAPGMDEPPMGER